MLILIEVFSILNDLFFLVQRMDFIENLISILKCILRNILRSIIIVVKGMSTSRNDVVVASTRAREQSARTEHPVEAFGWAARDESGVLSPFKFSRRVTGEEDVTFKVLYCGICHSDLNSIKNDWGNHSNFYYPIVPGHEIVGVVTEIGSKVNKSINVGDKVAVGSLIGSCGSCDYCNLGQENFCPKRIFTSNYSAYGGFSDIMVVNERFVIRWPDNLPLDAGAPLLCAGITTYSALKYTGLNRPEMHIGVVGLGGLGHLAVKFAKAFGAKVTVISTTPDKKNHAITNLKADDFIISHDRNQMEAAVGTLDGIIYTASGVHSLGPLVDLLKSYGVLVMLGIPNKPIELPVISLLSGRKAIAGSSIGGMKETQEMIDFAAEHGITADVEVIPIDYVNTAMERLAKNNDVKFRFVIDIANSLKTDL